MHRGSSRLGFTLMEVLLAVAILAGAVLVVLGLLPGLARQNMASATRLEAQRLPSALAIELRRVAAADFEALAARVPVMAAPLRAGFPLVASRSDPRVMTRDYLLPLAAERLATDQHYFLLECWRFPNEPLRYETGAPGMAVWVRVSWPYRLPGGNSGSFTATDHAERQEFAFTVFLSRD